MAVMQLTAVTGEQLRLALEVDEREPGEVISPEEAQLISLQAQRAFERAPNAQGETGWFREYAQLRDEGWPWRVAALIAWSASPRSRRWPETQGQLAREVLGLKSDRVIRIWKEKNPGIEAAIGLLQAAPLFDFRREIITALVVSATKPDHKSHQDRKLALEMLGDYTPKSELRASIGAAKDLSELSDAELAAAARALDAKDEG